jgi:hypothetical protein
VSFFINLSATYVVIDKVDGVSESVCLANRVRASCCCVLLYYEFVHRAVRVNKLGNVGVANNSGQFVVTAFRFVSSRMSAFDYVFFIVSFFLCF